MGARSPTPSPPNAGKPPVEGPLLSRLFVAGAFDAIRGHEAAEAGQPPARACRWRRRKTVMSLPLSQRPMGGPADRPSPLRAMQ